MATQSITAMTSKETFTKLLDDKENGLDDNLRAVWRHRHNNDKISAEKIDYQLRKFGYKEIAPGSWE